MMATCGAISTQGSQAERKTTRFSVAKVGAVLQEVSD
jgi:hypothetical protein